MRLPTRMLLVAVGVIWIPLGIRLGALAQREPIPIDDRIWLRRSDVSADVDREIDALEARLRSASPEDPALAGIINDTSAMIRRHPGIVALYRIRYRARGRELGREVPFIEEGDRELLDKVTALPGGEDY